MLWTAYLFAGLCAAVAITPVLFGWVCGFTGSGGILLLTVFTIARLNRVAGMVLTIPGIVTILMKLL